jgi:hydroxymethylpyrimidine/phosphomethylpyrimidine kinase
VPAKVSAAAVLSRPGFGRGIPAIWLLTLAGLILIIAKRDPSDRDDGPNGASALPNSNGAPPVALTIAGFDPSGGAGVAADLKTFAAHNCYGVAAITALTIQNTQKVEAVQPVSATFLSDCLESLAADGHLLAVKVGMLATADNARVVGAFLAAHPALPVVLDPVIAASGGESLLDPAGFDYLRRHLIGLATVITPNLSEAAALAGTKAETIEEMKAAARRLLELGARAVVVTGGHLDKPVDVYAAGDELETFAGDRLKPDNLHGAGCTFSSAIAANLALGRQLRDSVMLAKAYVAESIKKSYPVGPGRTPLNHCYRMQEGPRAAESHTFPDTGA